MIDNGGAQRVDIASRVIAASPHSIYRAYLDPDSILAWRPPKGMRGEIQAFDPRQGGIFRMAFLYDDADHPTPGKTSAHADMFEGRFQELVPDRRIVEVVEFQSDDPAFAGAMTIATSLVPVAGGTEVIISCTNVPSGISPSDHQIGLASSLDSLAAYTEVAPA